MQQFLTPYEADQVDQISSWLSERPSVIESVVSTVAAPIARVTSNFAVDLGTVTVGRMARLAALNDGVAEIAQAAGVADVAELKNRPLQECDALALQVSYHNEREALLEGMAFTGLEAVGPIVAVLADIVAESVELVSALRAITRIGHCYGYRLNRPQDMPIIEAVLEVAMLPDPVRRADRVKALHDTLDRKAIVITAEEARIANEAVGRVKGVGFVTQMAVDELVAEGPFAVFFDYHFERQVDIAARRIFQERWLRDNGKVTSVPPAPAPHRRSSGREVYDAAGQTAFLGGGALGFVVCLPVALLGRLFRGADNTATRGLRDGSADAKRTVRRWTGGTRPAPARFSRPAVAPTPA